MALVQREMQPESSGLGKASTKSQRAPNMTTVIYEFLQQLWDTQSQPLDDRVKALIGAQVEFIENKVQTPSLLLNGRPFKLYGPSLSHYLESNGLAAAYPLIPLASPPTASSPLPIEALDSPQAKAGTTLKS
jgi:hypothetical protein